MCRRLLVKDDDGRGGVLETEGTMEVKFRKTDITTVAHRYGLSECFLSLALSAPRTHTWALRINRHVHMYTMCRLDSSLVALDKELAEYRRKNPTGTFQGLSVGGVCALRCFIGLSFWNLFIIAFF